MNRNRRKVERQQNLYEGAGIISKWSFWWTNKIFRLGVERPLTEEDMYQHPKSLDSGLITENFKLSWQNEMKRKKPNVMHMLLTNYGHLMLIKIMCILIDIIVKLIQPILLGGLVTYFAVDQRTISINEGYFYATGIFICSLIPILVMSPIHFYTSLLGTKIRLGLSGLVYNKCQQISKSASNDGLRAKAINILSTDLGSIDNILWYIEDILRGPIETIIIGYLMYREIGVSAVSGLVFLLSFMPLQIWAAKKALDYGEKETKYRDLRIKLMNEIIQGIQVIKMYTWEKYFADVIADVRCKEMYFVRYLAYVYGMLKCTVMLSPLSVFLTLISYVYWGDMLTAKRVFMISCYFDILNVSIVDNWPNSLSCMAEAFLAARRTTEFLVSGEKSQSTEIPTQTDDNSNMLSKKNDNLPEMIKLEREYVPEAAEKCVTILNASASWENNTKKGITAQGIINASVHIPNNTLAAIIGPVGCGKSTLLNILLGEVELNSGEVRIHGKISYASQEAWIFEGSIRDNIIFVEPYDEHRYKQVLKVCALERDLTLLPHSDLTVVGERGVNLSGGQKARVNLARAVYRRADIYLLDDPLSAVDSHVGKHIFEHCIRRFLSGKIRILVTHQVQYLSDTQLLLLLRGGHIVAQGSYETLKQNNELNELLILSQHEDEEKDFSLERHFSRSDSEQSTDEVSSFQIAQSVPEAKNEEDRNEGSVDFSVYKFYFQAVDNPLMVVVIFCLLLLARVMLTGVDYFLSRWIIWEEQISLQQMNNTLSEQKANETATFDDVDKTRRELIIVYALILLSLLFVYILRTFGYINMSLRIALKLHDRLFRHVTHATMQFFNMNSSGRILNRFSKDVDMVDRCIYSTILKCFVFVTDLVGVISIVSITNYWLLVPAVLTVFGMMILRYYFVNASRNLTRIENAARSPVYTLTNQTFQGLITIRALQARTALQEEFHYYQNSNTCAWFLYLGCSNAFSFWLHIICALYVGVVSYSFLLMSQMQFSSGDVGLAILHSMTLISLCQSGLRESADLENEIISVERIRSYTKLPTEPALKTPEKNKPSNTWPSKGRIHFDSVSLRYSPKQEPVLKDLSFNIKSGEKIGIVGRTGAGKSSIIQALFRLACNEGTIRIDDVYTEELGLYDLRSKLSIIPQDPVLFSGTLRYNLDPTGECNNSELWKALADVELITYVSALENGLNYRLHDGGSNFSVGQRQLVCLARAILRKNKILILDEATANVDPQTDKLIQKTIRNKFADCTVLTIAHRLHTVMDCNRVLVMDSGKLVEFDHPHKLLQERDGHFYQLVRQTGSTTAATLRAAAERSYKNNQQCIS